MLILFYLLIMSPADANLNQNPIVPSNRQPRYSKEEFAQRGQTIYEAQIRSQLEAEPLIGMSLLYGFKIQIEAVETGLVTIEALK